MTAPNPTDPFFDHFAIHADTLARRVVTMIRVGLGVSGLAAIVLGVVLLVWPGHTIAVLAVIAGIYFLISGLVRLGVGVFARGIHGSMRALDIILGLLLVLGGWIVLRDWQLSAAVLLIFVVAVIGIGWIVEGVLGIVESGRAASRGWAVAYGAVSIVAGVVLLAVPGWSALWLVLIAGVVLVVLGIIGVVRAFTFGRVRSA